MAQNLGIASKGSQTKSYSAALTNPPPQVSQEIMAEINSVKLSALVVLRIQKHCASVYPSIATGSLCGMENGMTLEVTNCFPFPITDLSASDPHPNDHMAASNIASAAPRAKANVAYQAEMIKNLTEVNVDANLVGFYTSANMGNFINTSLIENLYHYQKEPNEHAIALVHDLSRSIQGAFSIKAYRLSQAFMSAYKEQKFNTENLQKSKLSYKDILIDLPIVVQNSQLVTQWLQQLSAPSKPPKDVNSMTVANFEHMEQDLPMYPNFDALDLSIDPYLEKTSEQLLESVESHHTELNNQQYHQRQMAREQTKVNAWIAKRKADNAIRVAAKQAPLPEDEWKTIFKLPAEPSRLEGLINARQAEQYSRQIDGFTATVTGKMFAVKNNLLPEHD